MNGKERILTALEVRETDCVPLYIHGITTFEIGHEEKLDDLHVKDGFGVVYKLSEHSIPVPVGHPVKTLAELKKFTPPVPRKEDLGLLNLAVERFKGQKATFWLMMGVFVRPWRLIGMTNYMMNVHTDPEFLHSLAKMMMEFNLAQLELLVEVGLDVLVIEDDIAMDKRPMISQKHFRILINHYNRQIVERAHQKGLKVVRHSDGNLWSLLDVLLESGYDGINPLEPQAGMVMKKVKAYYGDKICSSNSLHPGVNPENCMAMFKAVRKHGQYEKS